MRPGNSRPFDLDGVATVELVRTLERVDVNWKAKGWWGDFPPNATAAATRNPWAVTYAFVRGDRRASVLLSQVADAQALMGAQELAGMLVAYQLRERLERLDWRASQIRPQVVALVAGDVVVVTDRQRLRQVLTAGLKPEVGVGIALEMLDSFVTKGDFAAYFARREEEEKAAVAVRRKHYQALLATLEREELDYSPTPKVVVFNANLACQFYWGMFDRSGVPLRMTIVGRLGELAPLAKGDALGMTVDEFDGTRWSMKDGEVEKVVAATRWRAVEGGARRVGYLGLSFGFDETPPDLSAWLNELERMERDARMKGWLAREND
jgi:hypothetical protein